MSALPAQMWFRAESDPPPMTDRTTPCVPPPVVASRHRGPAGPAGETIGAPVGGLSRNLTTWG
ncbi:hypothetical protein [Candidatus Frankia alpina]|nr:hypothetical protein [Candidatus Frankia alpina]